MVETRRTFPGYERRLIGPHVIQNQNRCIHCSRCIRFTQEISETAQLTYKSRGNHTYIDTFDGKPFDDPMSACAADVCPVGALTVREFRFRKRAWKLRSTPSICPGCSIGCNILIEHHERVVYRFTPRENPAINATWLCDHGRFLAESLNEQTYLAPAAAGRRAARRVSLGRGARGAGGRAQGARGRCAWSPRPTSPTRSCSWPGAVRRATSRARSWSRCSPGEPRRMKNGKGEWLHGDRRPPQLARARAAWASPSWTARACRASSTAAPT